MSNARKIIDETDFEGRRAKLDRLTAKLNRRDSKGKLVDPAGDGERALKIDRLAAKLDTEQDIDAEDDRLAGRYEDAIAELSNAINTNKPISITFNPAALHVLRHFLLKSRDPKGARMRDTLIDGLQP
jgi:hypothetical protein